MGAGESRRGICGGIAARLEASRIHCDQRSHGNWKNSSAAIDSAAARWRSDFIHPGTDGKRYGEGPQGGIRGDMPEESPRHAAPRQMDGREQFSECRDLAEI